MKAIALLLLLSAPLSAQTWTRAHGGPDQAGFADVDSSAVTAFTGKIEVAVPGPTAPGVGPVIDTAGTAYLAALDGRLTAVSFRGAVLWTWQPPSGRKVFTAPVIGSDGSIYLAMSVGLAAPPPNDHRTTQAWLDHISPQGALLWEQPLPRHVHNSGAALAVNATGTGAAEVIAVAAYEPLPASDFRVNLVGFSPGGGLLFNQDVGGAPAQAVTGNGDVPDWTTAWLPCLPFFNSWCYDELKIPLPTLIPPVGIAVASGDIFVVTDGYNGIRGYHYTPASGLVKVFEKIDKRTLTSPAAVFPNQRSVYGVNAGRIAFAGPSSENVADINLEEGSATGSTAVVAPPARLASGRGVVVGFSGHMMLFDNVVPVAHPDLGGATVAGASASRDFIYLSTADFLVSFDAATGERVPAAFPWSGGGLAPVAIHRDGRIYALAGDTLHIFRNEPASGRVRVHDRPTRAPPVTTTTSKPRDHRHQ